MPEIIRDRWILSTNKKTNGFLYLIIGLGTSIVGGIFFSIVIAYKGGFNFSQVDPYLWGVFGSSYLLITGITYILIGIIYLFIARKKDLPSPEGNNPNLT